MRCVPAYLERIPVVAGLFHREMRKYVERHGAPADFGKGWWHPPVGPEAVLDSEKAQIDALGLKPLVSITDHDSLDACLAIRRADPSMLLSVEWTVPCSEGFFHVGVHNLAPATASSCFHRLSRYTRRPSASMLREVLAEINADPATLVVLNHPLWDLANVGAGRHVTLLSRFLEEHGRWIHALEANGYRSAGENARVSALAERLALPLISGGDRHGYAPNSLLNLTKSVSFAGFVREIRDRRASDIAVMPHYWQPLVARKLSVAGDVLRPTPLNPPGRRYWVDRVSYEQGGVVSSLSRHWPQGGPLWVRSTVRVFRVLTRAPFLRALAFAAVMLGCASADSSDPGMSVETAAAVPGGTAHHTAVEE